MAEYKVESINSGCDSIRLSNFRGDVFDIHVPGLCGNNRSLEFEFKDDQVIVTDGWDSSFRLKYDLKDAPCNATLNPL